MSGQPQPYGGYQNNYPPQGQGSYPPQAQGNYPPQAQYPPQGQGSYPPQSQQGNYPPHGQGSYPPQAQGGHPAQQGASVDDPAAVKRAWDSIVGGNAVMNYQQFTQAMKFFSASGGLPLQYAPQQQQQQRGMAPPQQHIPAQQAPATGLAPPSAQQAPQHHSAQQHSQPRHAHSSPGLQPPSFATIQGQHGQYKPYAIPFDQEQICVGIDWEFVNPRKEIDLDVACFVYSNTGAELDVVFFGNLQSADGSVQHSGDNSTGHNQPGTDDETIFVDLPKLHASVSCLVFPCVVQGKGKDFGDCRFCHVRLRQRNKMKATPLICYDVAATGAHPAYILCMLFRNPANPSQWMLNGVGLPSGARGLDQIDRDNDRVLGVVIPPPVMASRAPRVNRQALKKGQAFLLRRTQYQVGLGWDSRCDLDTHVFLCDSVSARKAHVYHAAKTQPGVRLLGDNRTGAGSGDDEIVMLDLALVDKSIDQLHFIVQIYDTGMNFGSVDGEYIRLTEPDTSGPGSGRCIAKFAIDSDKKLKRANAAWFCTLYRTHPGHNQWMFLSVAKQTTKKITCDGYESKFSVIKQKRENPKRKAQLTVHSGFDLLACDRGNVSDPYLVVNILTKKVKEIKTAVIKKTLNPQWNAQAEFVLKPSQNMLVFTCFDKDVVGKDDFMGRVELVFNESELPFRRRLNFGPGLQKKEKKFKGGIDIEVKFI